MIRRFKHADSFGDEVEFIDFDTEDQTHCVWIYYNGDTKKSNWWRTINEAEKFVRNGVWEEISINVNCNELVFNRLLGKI